MPGFIKTKADETRWEHAKQAVEKSKGKSEKDFTSRDYSLVNYIFHRKSGALIDVVIEAVLKERNAVRG